MLRARIYAGGEGCGVVDKRKFPDAALQLPVEFEFHFAVYDKGQTMTSQTSPPAENTQEKTRKGPLYWVERIGNALPDPYWLFVILAGVTVLASWLGSRADLKVEDPNSGEIVGVENLLTADGVQTMIKEAVNNFVSFPPLGVILIVMLGVAVAENSGLIGAAMRWAVRGVSPKWITFAVAMTAVTGSIASDAVFIIMIPLGAAAFREVGRSPITGVIVAFAASAGGFNASLLLNITDVLLGGITTSAAQFVDPDYEVSPLANYFFVMPSSIVLALLITVVTELVTKKRVNSIVDPDAVDYEEAAFDSPDEQLQGNKQYDAHKAASETSFGVTNPRKEQEKQWIQDRENKALRVTAIVFVLMLAAYFALLFVSGSPLQGPGGAVMESVLIRNIAVVIAVMFFVLGVTYGLVFGSINSSADIPSYMGKGIKSMVGVLVLFFAASQFLAYFEWSNLGIWIAVKGAEFLEAVSLPEPLLFALFVLIVVAINMFITSGSAQWALMAPIIVPMFMLLGVAPEVTQMLYRIGDAPASTITPMSPYFAIALTYLRQYYKKGGVGTLISLCLPHAVVMLVGWFLFFLAWYYLGIPLGPGTPTPGETF
ncbi:Aminobenzoyl-glutamate transport protein [Corynebacterium renale]|uniref:Aminobenzoyl-glutamate transport protein n=2 Tax=Corynebacterium renale TaxID=1724 RepID=A0A2A9DM99_9CORY|nr:aminobenzoyl-glutamate transport protein [Corynebacterium renale]SQI24381.1 Aminobenzoyl-glutamate transport protein [Corynebacterium renale]